MVGPEGSRIEETKQTADKGKHKNEWYYTRHMWQPHKREDLKTWRENRGSLSTVYNDGEISTCG